MNPTIIISGLSFLLAAVSFITTLTKNSTAELTTVIVKLEAINSGITDIKAEINSIKGDQRGDHDKLVRLETSFEEMKHQKGVEEA